jgi:hypothetical protein
MSVNRYKPHLFILPEDNANREIANGFLLDGSVENNQVQVLAAAGGWELVLSKFKRDHVKEMQRYPNRYMILLLDFDNDDRRRGDAENVIPDDLADRVFLLGVWSNPEYLRSELGQSLENIGLTLARECGSIPCFSTITRSGIALAPTFARCFSPRHNRRS